MDHCKREKHFVQGRSALRGTTLIDRCQYWLLGRTLGACVASRGGDEGTRTPDPLNAIEVLSQLSYIPTTWTLPTCGRANGRQPSVAMTPVRSFRHGGFQASSALKGAPYGRRRRARSQYPALCSGWLTTPVRSLCCIQATIWLFATSGAEGIRTPDLISAIDALSQLSYSPLSACWQAYCNQADLSNQA